MHMIHLVASTATLAGAACTTEPPVTKPAEPAVQAYLEESKDELLDYRLAMPAEVMAEPELAAMIKATSEGAKSETIEGAKEDKAYREEEGYPFNGYMLRTEVVFLGASEQLLSLEKQIATYTGGAHGNYGSKALLWDRQAKSAVPLDMLFANGDLAALTRDAWCDGLDAARREKFPDFYADDTRDRELSCPKISELAVMPVDADGNGRFEALRFHADPYVAGAYAEGDYEVDVQFDDALLVALAEPYRAAFERLAQ